MNYDTDILGVSIEENTHTICGKDIVSNKHELHKFKTRKGKHCEYVMFALHITL